MWPEPSVGEKLCTARDKIASHEMALRRRVSGRERFDARVGALQVDELGGVDFFPQKPRRDGVKLAGTIGDANPDAPALRASIGAEAALGQEGDDVVGGRARAVDDAYVVGDHPPRLLLDKIAEKRVMRAAEDDDIDGGGRQRSEVPLDGEARHIPVNYRPCQAHPDLLRNVALPARGCIR